MSARQLSVVLWSLGQIGFCPSDASMTIITNTLANTLKGTEEQVPSSKLKYIPLLSSSFLTLNLEPGYSIKLRTATAIDDV